MRVTFNSFDSSLLPRLQRLNQQQDEANAQIGTGQRLTNASDDPAAMGRVLNLRAEKRQLQQFYDNASTAKDIGNASYAALDDIRKIHTRTQELSVLGSSVAAPESFVAYAAEVDNLLEQALGSANRKHLGQAVFGGLATDSDPFTVTRNAAGEITNVTYGGTATGAEFRISNSETISPYTNGAENQNVAVFLNQLVALRDGLKNQDSTAVAAVRPGMETTETALLATITRGGGTQYRIETNIAQSSERFSALEGLVSKEADVDYAEAAVRFNKAQTAYTAALQSAAQIQNRSLLDYLR